MFLSCAHTGKSGAAERAGLNLDMLQNRVDSIVGFRIHLMFDESNFGTEISPADFGSIGKVEHRELMKIRLEKFLDLLESGIDIFQHMNEKS